MTLDELLHLDLENAPVGFLVRVERMCREHEVWSGDRATGWLKQPITTIDQLLELQPHVMRREPNIGNKTVDHLVHLLDIYKSMPPSTLLEELSDIGVFPA